MCCISREHVMVVLGPPVKHHLVHGGGVSVQKCVSLKNVQVRSIRALYISPVAGVVIRLHWLRLQQKAFRSITKSRGMERWEGVKHP